MRKSKRFAAIALVAAFGLVAAACGDDDKKTDTTSAPESSTGDTTGDTMAPPADIKAGVAFDTGGRGDGTFNDSAGLGADQAASELGIEVQELEANVDEDRKANLELLAATAPTSSWVWASCSPTRWPKWPLPTPTSPSASSTRSSRPRT